MTERQRAFHAMPRVIARRERHRRRSLFVRVPVATAGIVLGAAGIPLLLIPELGIPAVLLGLRLLALEFEGATSAQAWLERHYARTRHWVAGWSTGAKITVTLVALAGSAGLILVFVR
ncbi:PGPGW domain-containing protein [Nocardia goodfellowii]